MKSLTHVLPGFALIAIAFSGCMDFGSDLEERGLTNSEYVSRFNVGEGLPGAVTIDVGGKSTIDSGDSWKRVKISQSDYESALAKRLQAALEDGSTLAGTCYDGTPLERLQASVGSFPSYWPRPESTVPAWWNPGSGEPKYEVTAWEKEIPETPSASGECWMYDATVELLWTWGWSRQHFSLKERAIRLGNR